MSFRRVWSRFSRSTRTLGPTPGAREAWHQGRRWYHVTLLRIDDAAVVARRNAVLANLADVLTPFALDDLHITVFVHGFVDPARMRPPPWENEPVAVRIGGVNAFGSCVFLEARSPAIPSLRRRFSGPEERWSAYRPHVTVGLFRATLPVGPILPRLRPLRRLSPLLATGRLTTVLVDAFDPSGAMRRCDIGWQP